ncbi:phospholipase domain-containing protein [Actinokineospora sp.]|uniref:phospholipase domain-containing protein n=1 Tax=Actinokineospora sp. TaxID=1872133 RepID=UPI003D6B5B8D
MVVRPFPAHARDRPGRQAGADTSLAWPTDGGWYDVEVTAAEDSTFHRRLTGRVEDGAPGVTA